MLPATSLMQSGQVLSADTPTQVIRPHGSIPRSIPHRADASWPSVRGYEILSVIGSGGMGIVYKARQRDLRRTVALKMLRAASLTDLGFHGRFQAEAEAVARLQHPNIIQVFEIGKVEPHLGELLPSPFISLEYVSGGSLTQHTNVPQPPRRAVEMVEKLARAVHSAHRLGVVHRDLKPANVLLTEEGEPKIADFGLAKQLGSERDAGGRFLTLDGTVMGTPEYMAPEQAAGDAPTPAVDIYALGVILYELLTARIPFHAATPVETMKLVQRQEAVPPRQLQPGVARDLETICLKCLEKEPAKRYATAEALADDLQAYRNNRPIRARRVSEFEKLERWCRRNPSVAASLAGVVGIFLTAFLLVSGSYWRAEAALKQEAQQRQEAERREKAERWERYRANLLATSSAFTMYNVNSARRSLEMAPKESRNCWEWRHFQSRLDLARHVFQAGDAAVHRVEFSRNGDRAFVFGGEGFVRVWDTQSGAEIRTLHVPKELEFIELSPDGKAIVYATSDRTLALYDVDAGQVRVILANSSRSAQNVQFTADSTRIAACSDDHTVKFWDASSGKLLRVFRSNRSGHAGVRISPDGRRLATTERHSNNVRLWDLATGNELAVLAGHKYAIMGIYFHGERVVTAEDYPGNNLHLWNATTGQLIAVLPGHNNFATHVVFNADGTRIASSSLDQTLRLWDGASGQLVAVLHGHTGQVRGVAFSPNGKQLASASFDHTVRVWDAAAGTLLTVLSGHSEAVLGVAYRSDGKAILSTSADHTVRLWDAESDAILRGHKSFVYSVAFHPDGQRVVSAGWDGTARIWDVTTGREKMVLDHGAGTIVSAAVIHPNGRLLASRVRGSVCLWDLESGRELQRWKAASDSWRDTRLAFSPKGDLLATGCQGNEVRLWDVNTRSEVAVLPGHGSEVREVVFSPDGKWLVSATEGPDSTIRIWDVAKRELIHTLEGHRHGVSSLAFSPEGGWLASGSLDGTARLWDTTTWSQTGLLKHGSNVYGVALTPDGTRLACACADNSICLWDVATHHLVAELRGHNDYVYALVFSPDGARLVSASGDFTVRVWDTVQPQNRSRGR